MSRSRSSSCQRAAPRIRCDSAVCDIARSLAKAFCEIERDCMCRFTVRVTAVLYVDIQLVYSIIGLCAIR
nr:MAG TPA: hypothetical protein [Siphoviridae sp. ctkEu9]